MALKKKSIYSSTGVIHANHIEKRIKGQQNFFKVKLKHMGQADQNTLKSIIENKKFILGDGLLIFSHTLMILNLECILLYFKLNID